MNILSLVFQINYQYMINITLLFVIREKCGDPYIILHYQS